MIADKLIALVNDSELNESQKALAKGFIERSQNEYDASRSDRDLIEEIANEKNLNTVILSTDDVKIYTVFGRREIDIKYPFRTIYKDASGMWRKINVVAPTLDTAYIFYLEVKYLGLNSRFSDFALKMLEIGIN